MRPTTQPFDSNTVNSGKDKLHALRLSWSSSVQRKQDQEQSIEGKEKKTHRNSELSYDRNSNPLCVLNGTFSSFRNSDNETRVRNKSQVEKRNGLKEKRNGNEWKKMCKQTKQLTAPGRWNSVYRQPVNRRHCLGWIVCIRGIAHWSHYELHFQLDNFISKTNQLWLFCNQNIMRSGRCACVSVCVRARGGGYWMAGVRELMNDVPESTISTTIESSIFFFEINCLIGRPTNFVCA